MLAQLTAIITGRVQMVMYRDFVQRKARGLGILGTVRNLPDGSVEVIAEGEKELLEEFIGYLKKGSWLSRVEHVEVRWDNNQNQNFREFSILY